MNFTISIGSICVIRALWQFSDSTVDRILTANNNRASLYMPYMNTGKQVNFANFTEGPN